MTTQHPQPVPLDVHFQNFAKYTIKTVKDAIDLKSEDKEKKKDGKTITLRQIDFWFEQAKLFDRNLTRTDTGMTYIQFQAGCIAYPEFLLFLDSLSNTKEKDIEELKQKLMTCGMPGNKSYTVLYSLRQPCP